MARKQVLADDMLLMLTERFMNSWMPENWIEPGTPGYKAAREARLRLSRWRRYNKIRYGNKPGSTVREK